MPYFEIVYSDDATTKALTFSKVLARDRTEAAAVAMRGLAKAQATHGAKCYRVLDGLGMMVARSPTAFSGS